MRKGYEYPHSTQGAEGKVTTSTVTEQGIGVLSEMVRCEPKPTDEETHLYNLLYI